MRQLIADLLDREFGCWEASPLAGDLAAVIAELHPDLVVIDGADFHRGTLAGYPCNRMVVIGPEPDIAYRTAALRNGAGGWVARDDLAEQLGAEMRHALGCSHGPCPKSAPLSSPPARIQPPRAARFDAHAAP